MGKKIKDPHFNFSYFLFFLLTRATCSPLARTLPVKTLGSPRPVVSWYLVQVHTSAGSVQVYLFHTSSGSVCQKGPNDWVRGGIGWSGPVLPTNKHTHTYIQTRHEDDDVGGSQEFDNKICPRTVNTWYMDCSSEDRGEPDKETFSCSRTIEDEFIQESSECQKEHENLLITRIQISVEVLDPLLFLFPSISCIRTYVFPQDRGRRVWGDWIRCVAGLGKWQQPVFS